MAVGAPANAADQPVFFMPQPSVTSGGPADQEGVPFSPTSRIVHPPRPKVSNIPCAIEYRDSEGALSNFGVIVPSRVVLTLLDQDYAAVKGFDYVVIGGTKFNYRRTETPKGLVSVGLYRVHCTSEDEG